MFRSALAVAAAVILMSSSAAAQEVSKLEIRVSNGRMLPVGVQADAIERGKLTAAQFAYALRPSLALTATIGWARTRDLNVSEDPKLDVFTYDVGAELRAPKLTLQRALTLMPFAGAGAGARSYNHRDLDIDATHNAAAYGSLGGEAGVGRVRLRIEARNYVTNFSDLRDDVVLMAAVSIAKR
jgi:hypothetical protein